MARADLLHHRFHRSAVRKRSDMALRSMRTSGRMCHDSRPTCAQPLAPPFVRHHRQLAHDDGEEHADRRQRLTREARDGDGDAGMARCCCKGEHGAVVFIGSAEQMSDREPDQRAASTSSACGPTIAIFAMSRLRGRRSCFSAARLPTGEDFGS